MGHCCRKKRLHIYECSLHSLESHIGSTTQRWVTKENQNFNWIINFNPLVVINQNLLLIDFLPSLLEYIPHLLAKKPIIVKWIF